MSRNLKRPAAEEALVLEDFTTAHDAKRVRLNPSQKADDNTFSSLAPPRGDVVQSHESPAALRQYELHQQAATAVGGLRGALTLFFQQLYRELSFPHLPSELLDTIAVYTALPSLRPLPVCKPVVTVVVVISWPVGEARLGRAPRVTQFNSECDFRAYVMHLFLENPAECARWTRSFRRMQESFPIEDPDDDDRASVKEIGTGGKHLVKDLAPTDVLTWFQLEERFLEWMAIKTQIDLPDDLEDSYMYDYNRICRTMEILTDATAPLAEVIELLQDRRVHTDAIEVIVSQHPAQIHNSELYPHDDGVKQNFAGCVLLH
jgi:hypothetical protein